MSRPTPLLGARKTHPLQPLEPRGPRSPWGRFLAWLHSRQLEPGWSASGVWYHWEIVIRDKPDGARHYTMKRRALAREPGSGASLAQGERPWGVKTEQDRLTSG